MNRLCLLAVVLMSISAISPAPPERIENNVQPKSETAEIEEKEPSLEEIIAKEAESFGLDPDFVLKLATAESSLNPGKTGDLGEYGLFQIMPSTFNEMAEKMGYQELPDPYDPATNAKVACYYMVWIREYLGIDDGRFIALAYNWGPGNAKRHVRRYGCRIPRYFRNHPNLAYREIFNSYGEKTVLALK